MKRHFSIQANWNFRSYPPYIQSKVLGRICLADFDGFAALGLEYSISVYPSFFKNRLICAVFEASSMRVTIDVSRVDICVNNGDHFSGSCSGGMNILVTIGDKSLGIMSHKLFGLIITQRISIQCDGGYIGKLTLMDKSVVLEAPETVTGLPYYYHDMILVLGLAQWTRQALISAR